MSNLALEKILKLEQEYNLYQFKIGNIILWNLFRFPYRSRFISEQTGVSQISNKISLAERFVMMLKKGMSSLCYLIRLLLKHRKLDNLFFAYHRLQYNGNLFYDKFTDPVIEQSSLGESYCIVQGPVNLSYKRKRLHENFLISSDFFYILSILFIPFYFVWHIISGQYSIINKLYNAVGKIFDLSRKDHFYMQIDYIIIIIMSKFYSILFSFLGVKRVFGVARTTFISGTIAAHNLNIPVFEFQHGVTFGDTEYYSGPRCDFLDPDYFLSFGSMWNGHQFGIDPNHIINIGWAYKNEMKKMSYKLLPNSVLLISSPEISLEMLQVASELANLYPQFIFYIRCHPYEKYNEEQNRIINSIMNLKMDDNTIDSAMALCYYEYILGSNSSVVYEALSMGKKVGRICYNDIECSDKFAREGDGFFYLHNPKDFILFTQTNAMKQDKQAYSDFNKNIIEKLPLKNLFYYGNQRFY